MKVRSIVLWPLLAITLFLVCRCANAQTAFSYSGKLLVGGAAVTGTYDFTFTLYNAPAGGSAVGSTLTRLGVPVTTGAYTVSLDFGSSTFTTPPLYLQIAYRKSGTTTYTVLSSRLLLSVRFSVVASSAMALQGRPVSATAPTIGQALKWNGIQWAPGADANTTYTAGAGLALAGTVFSIATGSVVNAMLAPNAVTTAKIADKAVTSGKLAWPLSATLSSGTPLLSLSNSGLGGAIFGYCAGTSAIWGQSDSSDGVEGSSSSGVGIRGLSGSNYGVYGFSATNVGVYGENAHVGGVEGKSTDGFGVFGKSTDWVGVAGESDTNAGVSGISFHDRGVLGQSIDSIGVDGGSRSGMGVAGYSSTSIGVYGSSDTYVGIKGESVSDVGAWGNSTNASGVYGTSTNFVGVYGHSTNSFAGYFLGILTASDKRFQIDHPLDPANKYLNHACIESSERLNIYSGNVSTDAQGNASVALPDWFEALNTDFRYQLTVIGQFAQAVVATEITAGRFTIKTDRPFVKVSWQVTGVRKDAYALAHAMEVEQVKPMGERGLYLHPKEHGQPETLGIAYARQHRLEQNAAKRAR